MATIRVGSSRFPKLRGAYVSYLRFSDCPHSRYKIEAQRQAIKALLSPGRAHLVVEFRELASTLTQNRLELEKAIELCSETGATLVFGTLASMRGRVELLQRLSDMRVRFRAADLPRLYPSSFYELKHAEQQRRREISDSVKEALAKAKSQGRKLGGKRPNSEGLQLGPAASSRARGRRARMRDNWIAREIELIRRGGITTLTDIAAHLNEREIRAPRGGLWSASQVRRVMKNREDFDHS
jgi:DNA invertase Pin-like site-specific DNA recombinase